MPPGTWTRFLPSSTKTPSASSGRDPLGEILGHASISTTNLHMRGDRRAAAAGLGVDGRTARLEPILIGGH
jgi:hypothetical protein